MSFEAARARFGQGQYEEAAQLCLACGDAHAEARYLLAHCWLKLDEQEKACEALVQAAGLAPERAEVWHDLGVCYLDLGDPGTAGFAFQRAAELGRPEGLDFLAAHSVRDLIVMVDVSAQAAPHWGSVCEAVERTFSTLRPGERLALVGFNQDLTGYKQGIFCPAEEHQEAVWWLRGVNPSGKADMTVLLERVVTIVPEAARSVETLVVASGPVFVAAFKGLSWPFPLNVETVGPDVGPHLARLVEESNGRMYG